MAGGGHVVDHGRADGVPVVVAGELLLLVLWLLLAGHALLVVVLLHVVHTVVILRHRVLRHVVGEQVDDRIARLLVMECRVRRSRLRERRGRCEEGRLVGRGRDPSRDAGWRLVVAILLWRGEEWRWQRRVVLVVGHLHVGLNAGRRAIGVVVHVLLHDVEAGPRRHGPVLAGGRRRQVLWLRAPRRRRGGDGLLALGARGRRRRGLGRLVGVWAFEAVARGLRGRGELSKVECEAGDVGGVVFCGVEELEEVLQVSGRLVLEEALLPARCLCVPAVARLLLLGDVAEARADDVLPCGVDAGLVEEAVDDVRVVPVGLCAARLVVQADVVDVPVHGRQERGAEAARPRALLTRVLDDFVGVRARLAVVPRLVVLVECVCAPEDPVAVWARILLVPFVELVLVPLPVKLALEFGVASVYGNQQGSSLWRNGTSVISCGETT